MAGSSRPIALVLLRRSEHVLFIALLSVGVVGAWSGPRRLPLLAGAALVAAWYLVGAAVARRSRDRGQALGWLLVLTAGCAGLAVGSVTFVWLAFPLFLLYPQLLPLPLAVPAVAVLTGGTIATIAADRGRWDAAAVVGPLVGAAVAVVITVVYRDLAEQVRQRAALIDQLTVTRDQLAASERRAGVLAERERLAREIHDTITQSLTSIVLMLRTARDTDPAYTEALHMKLDTAIAAAGDALTDTRRLVHALAPAELAGQSLPQALRRIVANQSGLEARFHVEGDPGPVPTPAAVALLRAAQEALANVRAHARAQRVEVTLTFLPDTINLDIVDDGVGFDPALPLGPTTGSGRGLAGIRGRAEEVGGSIAVDSTPGHGTALNVTVPRGEASDE